MSKKIKYIDSICTTDTKKIFNICVEDLNNSTNDDILTYVADIQPNLEEIYNKGNISTEIGIINNLYLFGTFFIKSALKTSDNKSKIKQNINISEYANIFQNKNLSVLQNIQLNNVIYGITKLDTFSYYNITNDMYSYISSNTNHVLPEINQISTLLFNKNAISCENFDNIVLSNIENIQYNRLLEIPGYDFNDYDSGYYLGNTYTTKNHYSSRYNMEHDDQYILKNARRYIGLGSSNNLLYLKYYDDQKYSTNISSETSNELKYQQIEVIEALNRDFQNIKHKTSLFSLNIKIDAEISSNILSSIQQQIKNNLKNQLSNLVPANTQIFKINIT